MMLAINEKRPQIEACQKLINVMRKIIPDSKKNETAGGAQKLKFRFRKRKGDEKAGEGEEAKIEEDVIIYGKNSKQSSEPTAIDELLEYLYSNYSELFIITGEEKKRVMLEKEQVLKVLDDIPEELLERWLVPPKGECNDIEIQTLLSLNPCDSLGKNDLIAAYNAAYSDETDGKKKDKGINNMLLKSIGKFLLNKKEKILPMGEANTFKLIQTLLDDKLQQDLEWEKFKKPTKNLPNYVLDQLSMKFGLKTIAIKNLISLKEGLGSITKTYKASNPNKTPYSLILTSIMGLDANIDIVFNEDQTELIVKSRPLWLEAQEQFKKNIKVKRGASISDFSLSDLQTGGTWSVLEVIDTFTVWCGKDKDLLNSFLPWILPEFKADEKNTSEEVFYLNFSLMKICSKVAKLGKDVKYFYNILDEDSSGSLDPQEILTGLREKFSIYFSKEEAEKLWKYLDEDGSGDVDLEEFKAKISYDNFNNNYHLYMITYMKFLELLLNEWNFYKERTYTKFQQKFVEFDDNGDGVLTFEEFETLVNNLDKTMDRANISEIFNETLEMDEKATDMDKMNPEWFCEMAFKYKLGGFGKCFLSEYLLTKKAK